MNNKLFKKTLTVNYSSKIHKLGYETREKSKSP